MKSINGIDVILYDRTVTGQDELGIDIYSETSVVVKDVLVAPLSSVPEADNVNIDGKKESYILAIPKGDDHVWTDRTVEFWGRKWKTVAYPQQGIDDLIPLRWNKKVQVEAYD